jgi:hypothetical protein
MTWQPNDDGTPVPRRTSGSVESGYTQSDFTLTCHFCPDDFGSDPELPMGVVGAHFDKHHPGQKIELDLLWLGQGPSPEPRPSL